MKEEIHIGKLIRQKMEDEGRKVSWLAKRIGCSRNNVYQIYQHQSIDAKTLIRICISLEINLFYYYYKYTEEQILKKRPQNATFN